MKEDPIFTYYLSYLENRLSDNRLGNKLTKSQYSLLKISSSHFSCFKERFEEDELFNKRIIELHKSEIRNNKINDIIDETD